MPGGDATSIHIGNAFCVLAALLLGGVYGGLAGAIGMGIADIMDPVYITGAPKTFVLKFCIGLIVGLVAHKVAKINESTDKKYVFKWSVIASVAGLAFNVIADPIVGYFYKQYILGQPQKLAEALAKMKSSAILINTARGPIVNQPDLAEALNKGFIGGAGLDVVDVEPMTVDNPLLHAKNCVITPHIAWAALETRQRLLDQVVSNLRAYIEGVPVNVVNPEEVTFKRNGHKNESNVDKRRRKARMVGRCNPRN